VPYISVEGVVMVTRIVFSLCLWVVVARWGYSEMKILCPDAIPAVDYVLEHVQIPTHDKWPKEAALKLISSITTR